MQNATRVLPIVVNVVGRLLAPARSSKVMETGIFSDFPNQFGNKFRMT